MTFSQNSRLFIFRLFRLFRFVVPFFSFFFRHHTDLNEADNRNMNTYFTQMNWNSVWRRQQISAFVWNSIHSFGRIMHTEFIKYDRNILLKTHVPMPYNFCSPTLFHTAIVCPFRTWIRLISMLFISDWTNRFDYRTHIHRIIIFTICYGYSLYTFHILSFKWFDFILNSNAILHLVITKNKAIM